MLEYVGREYNEKRQESMEEWLERKYNLGLEFPNLPYLLDGNKFNNKCHLFMLLV